MSDKKTSGGIGFMGVLQVALIVLKLCRVINWSWTLVLFPLWIDLFVLFVLLILIIFLGKR